MSRKVILTAPDIRRTLARIAHEIIEQNGTAENLVLVGLRTRGVPLANRLAVNIASLEPPKVDVGALDITYYRDDISSHPEKPVLHRTDIPTSIDGKSIVMVDDVLYTGRSARAAMDALIDLGRPKLIQLAVLIDRGHREMPIRPDFVGKNIPSSRHEDIRVQLTEVDGIDEVSILSSSDHKPDNRSDRINSFGRS